MWIVGKANIGFVSCKIESHRGKQEQTGQPWHIVLEYFVPCHHITLLKRNNCEMIFQLETEHSDKELYQIIVQLRPVQMISYLLWIGNVQ